MSSTWPTRSTTHRTQPAALLAERRPFLAATQRATPRGEPAARAPELEPGFDPVALTRDIVGGMSGVYALHVVGDAMADALVGDGDVVLIQRAATAANGELVALRDGDGQTRLRRIYFEDGAVRLQPENRNHDPVVVAPGSFEIEGSVVAIIRRRR